MSYRGTELKYNNYFVEIDIKNQNQDFNLQEFANNFKLDLDYSKDGEKYKISQDDKQIAGPYKLSEKLENYTSLIKGYVSLRYFKKDEETINSLSKPRVSIPIGCYCEICNSFGYIGHRSDCKAEKMNSHLYITFEGIIHAFDIIKQTLKYLGSGEEKIMEKFKSKKYKNMRINLLELINDDDKYDYKLIMKFIDLLDSEIGKMENKDIDSVISSIKKKIIDPNDETKLTQDEYNIIFPQSLKDVSILKYDMFFASEDPDAFHGSVLISYVYKNKNKTNIRVNSTDKITFVTAQYEDPVELSEPFFIKFLTQNNILSNKYIISTSSLSFDIDLDKKSFYIDEVKKVFENSDSIYTLNDGKLNYSLPCYYYKKNGNIFSYSLTDTKNGTVLKLEFFRYESKNGNKNGTYSLPESRQFSINEFNKTGESVVVQIYSTGKVQLTFKLGDKNKANFEFENYKTQVTKIKDICTQVKNVLLNQINNINKDIATYNKNVKKEILYNTLTGLMPYKNVAYPQIGTVVQLYDRETESWADDTAIIINNKSKDSENRKRYTIINTYYIKKVSSNKLKNSNNLYMGDIEYHKKIYKFLYSDSEYTFLLKLNDKYQQNDILYEDMRIIYTKYNDKTYKKGKTAVSSIKKRPDPYSFYGVCPYSQTAIVDKIGNRSRIDNHYYPECNILTEKEYQKYKKEMSYEIPLKEYSDTGEKIFKDPVTDERVFKDPETGERKVKDAATGKLIQYVPKYGGYIHDGVSNQVKELGFIETKKDPVTGAVIDDFYSGTLIPGINELNSDITFWDFVSSSWKKGIIYEITNGKNKDGRFKKYKIQTDEYEDTDDYPIITSEQFHPSHKESRNFRGINNIPEEKLKTILKDCAISMNLLENHVVLDVNVFETKIFANISDLFHKEVKCYKDIVMFGAESMNVDNMKRLAEQEHSCVIIHASSLRTVLYINGKKHRIIDKNNRVYKCKLDIMKNNEDDIYIIDGYYNNNKNTFYAIDMIYSNSEYLKNIPYVYRSKKLVEFSKKVSKFVTFNEGNIDFVYKVGPNDKNDNLYNFINKNKSTENEMIFIQRNIEKGDNNYLFINSNIYYPYLTFQIIRFDADNKEWILGMDNKEMPSVYNLKHPGNLESKYVKLKLNINNENGEIYMKTTNSKIILVPYYDILILDEVDKKLSYNDLYKLYNSLIKSVHMSIFNKWIFTPLFNNKGKPLYTDSYTKNENDENIYKLTRRNIYDIEQ